MFVQTQQHMTIMATNPDQITARQHAQSSVISHLSPAMNQARHAQAGANFSSMSDNKDVRLQRLQMLQESLKNEATSSKDPRSRAYATLHERTIDPELRSRNFLEIPVAREGLLGGKNDGSSWEINNIREEISLARLRIDNIMNDLNEAREAFSNASDEDKGRYYNRIGDINERLVTEQMNLRGMEERLSFMLRYAQN